MNQKTILTHVLVLAIGIAIGHYIIPPKATKKKSETTHIEGKTNTKATTIDSLALAADTLNTKATAIPVNIKPTPPVTEQPAPSSNPTPTPDKPAKPAPLIPMPPNIGPTFCEGNPDEMQKHLTAFSEQIEAAAIKYNSEALSDCSGMFHRVLQSVKGQCPGSTFPKMTDARSSRGIARWFHDNSNLIIVEDAKASGHLIRPGAILFFSNIDVNNTELTIEKLEKQGGINHVSVVTEITRNKETNTVENYKMFHGRSGTKIAKRTKGNPLKPTSLSQKNLPVYGYWKQHWVAVAYLK